MNLNLRLKVYRNSILYRDFYMANPKKKKGKKLKSELPAKESKSERRVAVEKELIIPETSGIHQIEYLSCQGGGMKGIGFVTAVKELEKHGVLSRLKEVAGSSAGAIFATLVAVGYTAKEIEEKMMELDFRELMDKDKTWWDKLPFKKAGEGIDAIAEAVQEASKDPKKFGKILGTPIHYLGKAVGAAGKVAKGLLSLPGAAEDAAKLLVGKETGMAKGEALLDLVSEMIAAKTGNANTTFNDLARLSDATDGKFKKLILTGSNLTPREGEDRLIYFKQGGKYGDMSIKDAVRISAGFPGAFKAVSLVDPDGHVNTMVDGGLLENLPDVFNKKPYWNGPEGSINPKCFALSFEVPPPPPGTKAKLPKNLKDVGLACLESLTDEDPMKEKYGHYLANISTKGVGTLEFDASDKRRENLKNSGGEAVRAAFRKILKAEKTKKMNYDTLVKAPLDELVRLEVALEYENPQKDNPLLQVKLDIIKILNELAVTQKAEIDKLREQEKHILNRRHKAQGKEPLSDSELVESCQEKIKTFNNRLETLKKQRDFLKDVKASLEFREAELGAKLKHLNVSKELKNDFKSLEEIQKDIKRNREEHVALGLDEEFEERRKTLDHRFNNLLEEKNQAFQNIRNKHKDDDLLLKFFAEVEKNSKKWASGAPIDIKELERVLSEDVLIQKLKSLALIQDQIKENQVEKNSPGVTDDRKKELQKTIDGLQNEKKAAFDKIKSEYQGKDELLYQYFDELEEASNKSWNFQIPLTTEAVKLGLHKDVLDCDKDLRRVEKLINNFEKRQIVLDKYANSAFQQRQGTSERYKSLLNLKKALDITIDRTTVPFVEWISKFVDKRPGREKSLKNWLIRGAAALSFVVWTIGLVAVLPFTAIGYLITKGAQKYGNPKMKAAAQGVLDWFSWQDPVLYAKTKEMREVTADCVNVLNQSFGKNINTCEAVYKPFSEYFLKSGLNIEDLKPKANEDPKDAEKRIGNLKLKIDVLVKELPKEELDTFRRLEEFAKLVIGMSQDRRTSLLIEEITKIEKRFKTGDDLTKLEVSKYITAVNMLKRKVPNYKHDFPKDFMDKYKDTIESVQKSPTLLHLVSKIPSTLPPSSKDAKIAQENAAQLGEGKKKQKVHTAVTFLTDKKQRKGKSTIHESDGPQKNQPL